MDSRFSSAVLWFQQYRLTKMKPSTVQTMQGHIHNYLLPQFGGMALHNITAEKVTEWLSSDAVSNLSRKTMRHLVTTLSMITRTRFPKGSVGYPSETRFRQEQPFFTAEQMTRIIERSDGVFKLMYSILSESGIRAGELYALEIGDIDFINNRITVRRSSYNGTVQTPKTPNAYRTMPVKPWVIQAIREHIGTRSQGLILMTSNGTPFRHTYVLKEKLHPLLRELHFQQCGFHAFRHGRVSVLVEAGVVREVIKKWIGHGADKMIDTYLHIRAEWQEQALAQVPSMLPPTISGDSSVTPFFVM